jgi:hypothetical protein
MSAIESAPALGRFSPQAGLSGNVVGGRLQRAAEEKNSG